MLDAGARDGLGLQVGAYSLLWSRGEAGVPQQEGHMDFQLCRGLVGVLFAFGEGVRWVNADGVEVELPPGSFVVFEANTTHAGASYPALEGQANRRLGVVAGTVADRPNLRAHVYVACAGEDPARATHLHNPATCVSDRNGRVCLCSFIT